MQGLHHITIQSIKKVSLTLFPGHALNKTLPVPKTKLRTSLSPVTLSSWAADSLRHIRSTKSRRKGKLSPQDLHRFFVAGLHCISQLKDHLVSCAQELRDNTNLTSTWWKLSLTILIGALICLIFLCFSGRNRRVKSTSPLQILKNILDNENLIEVEPIDSDEFEFEEDIDAESMDGTGSAWHLSQGHRAGLSKEQAARRPGTIIRITSSDPLSQLSQQAFQMDLDHKRRLEPCGPHGSPHYTTINGRRRKESGRLQFSIQDTSGAISKASGVRPSTPSRVYKQRKVGSRGTGSGSPLLKERRFADQKRNGRFPSSDQEEDMLEALSCSPVELSPDLAGVSSLDSPRLASILRREPKRYASLPSVAQSADGSGSSSSHPSSTSSWTDGVTSSSPVSSLPPGAAHAKDSPFALPPPPPFPRLGTLTVEQARAMWPEKNVRLLRLKEPDWTPYVAQHIRARERLQAAADAVGAYDGGRSISPLPPAPRAWDDDLSLQRERDFWFERFTPSTAAAGRDWDWRKRRAREAASKKKALHDASSLTALSSEPVVKRPSATPISSPLASSPDKSRTSNLGRALNSIRTSSLPSLPPPNMPSSVQKTNGNGGPPPSVHLQMHHHPSLPDFSSKEAEADGQGRRLGSLKPDVVKRIRSRREKEAALTAQLLKQAENIDTDEDEEDVDEREACTNIPASSHRLAPLDALPRSHSSPSVATLDAASRTTTPHSSADVWHTRDGHNGAWSSADAYGSMSISNDKQGTSLFARPTTLSQETQGDNLVPPELALLYSDMFSDQQVSSTSPR